MKDEAVGFVRGMMHTLKWRHMKTESDWLKITTFGFIRPAHFEISLCKSTPHWKIHIKTGFGTKPGAVF